MPKLIGNNPNQVSTNGMLGNMAFQNREAVSVGNMVYTGTLTGGTGTITIGGSQIVKDANGNVGIGTNSPTERLQLENSSTVQVAAKFVNPNTAGVSFGAGASGSAFVYQASAQPFIVFTNATERMRVDATGNVGIGTSSPGYKLDVTGSARVTATFGVGGPPNSYGVAQIAGDSNDIYSSQVSIRGTTDRNKLLFVGVNTTGNYGSVQAFQDGTGALPLVLQPNSGNVGIGTNNPGTRLDVSVTGGMLRVGGGSGNNLIQTYTGSVGMGMWAGGSSRLYSTGGMTFSVNATIGTGAPTGHTDAVLITSTGDVGIGISPTAKLHVASGNAILGTAVGNTTTVPDQTALEYTTDTLPTIRPTLLLDFVNTSVLDSRVTFTRSSTGTYTDKNGVLQTAATNVPRFDYDPVTLAPRGLLIEEQRTNLTLHSAVTSANWTAVGGALTNTGKTAPDGTSLMGLFTEDTASSAHQAYVTAIPSVLTISTTYTASVYLAAGTRRYVFVHGGTNVNGWGVTVDTTTWTISGNYFIGGCTYASSSITHVGNNIYRVTVTGTQTSGGGTQAYVVVGGSLVSNAVAPNTTYTGTGATFYAWGAQLEAGSFATSYIPTVASQVTRSADVATMTGANFSNWYRQDEGSFVTSGSTISPSVTNARLIWADDTSGTVYQRGLTIAALPLDGYWKADVLNSGTQAQIVATTTTTSGTYALGYKENSFAGTFNGALLTPDNSGTVPSGINVLRIGYHRDNTYMNGHIRRIAYYPRRLSDTTLQGMTR